MTSNTIYTSVTEFKPTYLYIKQHAITGKLYFGKTTRSDPLKYIGSGIHWLRHIKLHGTEHVITLWCELFTDIIALVEFATLFSLEMNIVESKQWLNLIRENGLDGIPAGTRMSEETKSKMRKLKTLEHRAKMTGRTRSAEHCKNIGISHKGKVVNDSGRKNISSGMLNAHIKRSDEFKQHASELYSNGNHPNYGKRVYNDGFRNYMLFETDERIEKFNLKLGRTST